MIINDMYNTKDINFDNQEYDGTEEHKIFEYGDEKLSFLVRLLKLWIKEESFFSIYEPVFNSYTVWLNRHTPNIDFYDYLQYTVQYNPDIFLADTTFKIDIDNGTLIDYIHKDVVEIDAMIYFNNYVLYIKGMKFWIANSLDPSKQYFYNLNT